ATRQTSIRDTRITLLIFLVPALYNVICFSIYFTPGGLASPTANLFRLINVAGLLLLFLGIWFFGFAILEFSAGITWAAMARTSDRKQWDQALYATLRRAPAYAIPGALLWVVWVFGFYQLQIPIMFISIPVGIVSHLLALRFYMPLMLHWYRMARAVPVEGNAGGEP
ncbi:MAG: hypothetical protein AAFN70_05975, partial [Planctomycetota bacterium]